MHGATNLPRPRGRCPIRKSFPAIAAVALALSGCAPKATSPAENREWMADLSTSAAPLVTFGRDSASATRDLSSFLDATLLSDGRLAVLCCDNQILVYAPDGALSATYGGRGEGPGLFRSPRMAHLPGDTLLIYDRGLKRLSRLTASDGFLDAATVAVDLPFAFSTPLGVDAAGTVYIASLNTYSDRIDRSATDSVRTAAPVAALPRGGPPRQVLEVPDLLLISRKAPFGPAGGMILDHVRLSGMAVIRLRGDTLYALPGGASEVRAHGADGRLVRTLPFAIARSAVTPAMKAAYTERETAPLRTQSLGGHPPPPDLPAALAFLETATFADSLPAADNLILDSRSLDLWLVHGRLDASMGWRATRIAPTGAVVSRVESKLGGSTPIAFADSVVLVSREDESGVLWFEILPMDPVRNDPPS